MNSEHHWHMCNNDCHFFQQNQSIILDFDKLSLTTNDHNSSLLLPPALPKISLLSHSEQSISVNQAVKFEKTRLTMKLQKLSEKTRDSNEFLMKLKLFPERIQKNAEIFEKNLLDEFDQIFYSLENKKQELLNQLHTEIERKISLINQQCSSYNDHIQQTTDFLQYSLEILKHSDSNYYLQMSSQLTNQCALFNEIFTNQYQTKSLTSIDLDLKLNIDICEEFIQQLQLERTKPPTIPRFLSKQCAYHDKHSAILAWSIDDIGPVQSFVLELDQGTMNSSFQEIYHGIETICVVDGLHSSNIYTVRLKAYNQSGESAYSDCLSLHSSFVDWFTFNPHMSHPDIEFLSNDYLSLTSRSLQDRIALGSRILRVEKYYWQIRIDQYNDQSDPAFGIASFDIYKDQRLGKDSKSWCMYIDHQRSWFMHNNQHQTRLNRGIQHGSVIGILVDFKNETLQFFLDNQQHGSMKLIDLQQNEIYYPAVSLNKNVHVTLLTDDC